MPLGKTMDMLSVTLLIVWPLLLVSFIFLWWMDRREQRKTELIRTEMTHEAAKSLAATLMSSTQEMMAQSLTLNRQAQSLLAAKDPLAYQQIEAMAAPSGYDAQQYATYDPSDEAEIERIKLRGKRNAEEDDLDPDEYQRVLADLTGIDPDFYTDTTS
jgi:heme/copper-type cytochrome/quinol oxidase subunit 2